MQIEVLLCGFTPQRLLSIAWGLTIDRDGVVQAGVVRDHFGDVSLSIGTCDEVARRMQSGRE